MKRKIKATIACLFICKTTIMVNKREKKLLCSFFFRQTAILFLAFSSFFYFIAFLLLFSSFFHYLLRFNFVVSERAFFCADLSFLFWTFLSGTFIQAGGCMCTQCTPCVRACKPCNSLHKINNSTPSRHCCTKAYQI